MAQENTTQTTSETFTSRKTPFEWAVFVISVAYACFFLYTAFSGPFTSIVQRGFHVCAGLIIWCLLDLNNKKKTNKIEKGIDLIMIVILAIMMVYYVSAGKSVLMPTFKMTTPLFVMGILFMICVMEVARRTIGIAVPILSLIGLAYALLGKYIPGTFGHAGFKLQRVMEIIAFSDRGILGSVTGISATIIATFVIFGAILFATGGGETFINLASLVAGNSAGGAAKMASVASGLFGMISGSSAANVATTGAFTIPMMKRMGYSNDFAGASEASASSGGQIMPPIMGAGAFIMADMLGVTYKEIAIAAIIPSVLFYVGVIWGIDCFARRYHYRGIPKDEIPAAAEVLKPSKCLPVFLPIGILIVLFLMGFTAVYCASWSIVAAVVLYLVMAPKELVQRVKNLIHGLADATKDMLTVIPLIACSQILVALISTTGVGVKFTNIIVELGGSSMLLAGLCAMIATMILGMGMPTVAAYVLAGSVIAPALVKIGVEPLAAHFFVFYYAIFAGLTPPVCGTVFVASAMAESNWVKTAWIAIRLSIGAFLVPFILIFNPGMILIGTTAEIVQTTVTSLFGIFALGAGFMGYLTRNLNWPVRIILVAAGIAMVDPGLITDVAGIVCILAIVVYLVISGKRSKAAGRS
ncbi:MAG: TRAP transporter fused permease subunit [Lawsonibacter sp.]|nr:TRAP transporter fused permease subunit [Lawsonibacter sp.]MCI9155368.1 TRAP transporter fused permease subunit [Lawsonibacter sp.]